MEFPLRKILPCEHYYQKRDQSAGAERPEIGTTTVKEGKHLNAGV